MCIRDRVHIEPSLDTDSEFGRQHSPKMDFSPEALSPASPRTTLDVHVVRPNESPQQPTWGELPSSFPNQFIKRSIKYQPNVQREAVLDSNSSSVVYTSEITHS